MADDYIGKKMEDYRRGIVGNSYKPRTTSRPGVRPGYWSMKFTPLSVFVVGGNDGTGQEIVKTLIEVGCRVSFCHSDEVSGSRFAQQSGAQFVSLNIGLSEAMGRVARLRSGLETLVVCGCPTRETIEAVEAFLGNLKPGCRGRIIYVRTPEADAAGVSGLKNAVEEILKSLERSGATFNCVDRTGADADVAAIVTFLCSPAAARLDRCRL